MFLVVFGIAAFVAGALAAANFVIERMPNAKDLLDKIVPYQAFIGLGVAVFGIFKLFDITRMRESGSTVAIFVGCVIASIVVGFLLGFPIIH